MKYNKGTSNLYLREMGANVIDYHFIYPGNTMELGLYLGKKMSIRTYKGNEEYGKGAKKLDPFFPNMVVDESLSFVLAGLLEEGYTLMFCNPIDPNDSILRGKMIYNWPDRSGMIELMRGPGTVRDLEKADKDSVTWNAFTIFNSEEILAAYLGHKYALEIRDLARRVARDWDKNIVLEWSLLKVCVGVKNENLIIWEACEL